MRSDNEKWVILAWRASNWVDGVKFIVCSTIPNVLPFLNTELNNDWWLGNNRYELASRLYGDTSPHARFGLTADLCADHVMLQSNITTYCAVYQCQTLADLPIWLWQLTDNDTTAVSSQAGIKHSVLHNVIITSTLSVYHHRPVN